MKTKITILLFLITLHSIKAQDSSRVSLQQLLEQVENNYPTILQYQYNIEAWKQKAEGSKAWMPPTVSAGLMRWPYDLMMINDKNDPMNQAGVGITVDQMIPNATKLNAKKDYLLSMAEVEKSKSNWTKNELKKEAKQLYYNRYINEKKIAVVKESEEALSLLIAVAEANFSNNQSQLQTIYKAKAREAELKNMLYMLEASNTESTIGINTLLVRDVYAPLSIDTNIVLKEYHFSLTDTTGVSIRSDITVMDNYINSMRLEQEVMKSGYKPDFGIQAQHMQMFGMPNQWSLMGMMTIPIAPWSSKMYSTEIKAMDFQVQAMEQEKLNMELMAKRMLYEKLMMLNYEKQQYDNYKNEIIPAFENSFKAGLLAYKQNTGNLFVMIDAWEMLLMKKMEMLDKFYNVLKLQTEYEYEKEIR